MATRRKVATMTYDQAQKLIGLLVCLVVLFSLIVAASAIRWAARCNEVQTAQTWGARVTDQQEFICR